MGQSIAHPAPLERAALLRRLLAAADDSLVAAASAADDESAAAALGEFVSLVRSIDATSGWPGGADSRERLPVCRFWDRAMEAGADGAAGPLVSILRALEPSLTWAQNPNYRRRPPDPTFLDNYGYAVIVGPGDGPPGLAVDLRLALGVLLLGPGAHYPLHAHPATEIYYTLTSEGEWWKGEEPWRREPAATAIHHAPNVPHATRAGGSPLLALYLWRGDLATHATLSSHTGTR